MQPTEKQPTLPQGSTWRDAVGRGILLAVLVAALVWGGRLYNHNYPVEAEIRYIYRDIPQATELLRVVAQIHDATRKNLARVVYFHHQGLHTDTKGIHRTQRLRLLRGSHTLTVALYYRNGRILRLTKPLAWEESGGRHLVQLASAR